MWTDISVKKESEADHKAFRKKLSLYFSAVYFHIKPFYAYAHMNIILLDSCLWFDLVPQDQNSKQKNVPTFFGMTLHYFIKLYKVTSCQTSKICPFDCLIHFQH